MSTTVRLPDDLHEQLLRLSNETGKPMSSIIRSAIAAYEGDRFFASLDRAYDLLWSNSEVATEEIAERRLFEGTLVDDLQDE